MDPGSLVRGGFLLLCYDGTVRVFRILRITRRWILALAIDLGEGKRRTSDCNVLNLGYAVHGDDSGNHEWPQGLEELVGVVSVVVASRDWGDVQEWAICACQGKPLSAE